MKLSFLFLLMLTACGGPPFENTKLARLGDSGESANEGGNDCAECTSDSGTSDSDRGGQPKFDASSEGNAAGQDAGNNPDAGFDASRDDGRSSQDAGRSDVDASSYPLCCNINQLNGNNVNCYPGNSVRCTTQADCTLGQGNSCNAWPNTNESQCPNDCCTGVITACQ